MNPRTQHTGKDHCPMPKRGLLSPTQPTSQCIGMPMPAPVPAARRRKVGNKYRETPHWTVIPRRPASKRQVPGKPRKHCCGHLALANLNSVGRFSCPPNPAIVFGNLRFDPGQ